MLIACNVSDIGATQYVLITGSSMFGFFSHSAVHWQFNLMNVASKRSNFEKSCHQNPVRERTHETKTGKNYHRHVDEEKEL